MYTIIVSSKGQVVIPAEIRKKFNIEEGDILSAHIEEGGRLVLKAGLKKRVKEGAVERTAGLLSDMEMTGLEYVENIRRDSGRRLNELENRC